jgi:hypothetical protein
MWLTRNKNMRSSESGIGSPISAQDATDLLHKLMTESIKVQAAFIGRGAISTGVIGFVEPAPRGLIGVTPRTGAVDDPFLIFDPLQATDFRYGDVRSFPDISPFFGGPKLTSALCFIYPDGVQVVLFEIAQ